MGANDEMATREMDPAQFRDLLAQESARTRNARTPTIPATSEVMNDLVAQTREDDLAIPVADEPHAPHEPLALAELDPRQQVRASLPRLPTAPARGMRLTVLLVVLVLAIGGAVAYYVLTGRVV